MEDGCTAFVTLHEGRRLGWKILRGERRGHHLDSKYFGIGPDRPPGDGCSVETGRFGSWRAAVEWCASFPAHPAEGGGAPA